MSQFNLQHYTQMDYPSGIVCFTPTHEEAVRRLNQQKQSHQEAPVADHANHQDSAE